MLVSRSTVRLRPKKAVSPIIFNVSPRMADFRHLESLKLPAKILFTGEGNVTVLILLRNQETTEISLKNSVPDIKTLIFREFSKSIFW